jgi:hypothetical protein
MTEISAIAKDTEKENQEQTGSFTLRRKIRSTAYEVVVHFSQTSRETLTDKVLRLIRNETR